MHCTQCEDWGRGGAGCDWSGRAAANQPGVAGGRRGPGATSHCTWACGVSSRFTPHLLEAVKTYLEDAYFTLLCTLCLWIGPFIAVPAAAGCWLLGEAAVVRCPRLGAAARSWRVRGRGAGSVQLGTPIIELQQPAWPRHTTSQVQTQHCHLLLTIHHLLFCSLRLQHKWGWEK